MPSLLLGDTAVIKNLGSHKGKIARRDIRPEGAKLFFLSPHSPSSFQSSKSPPSSRPGSERPSNRKRGVDAHGCLAGLFHAPRNAPTTSSTPDTPQHDALTLKSSEWQKRVTVKRTIPSFVGFVGFVTLVLERVRRAEPTETQ